MEPRPPPHGTPLWPVIAVILLALPHALQGLPGGDTDTFYHLAAGRAMVEDGRLLDREIFSFTIPGQLWTNYHWLFQQLLYRLFRLGGFPALIALRAVLMVVTLGLTGWWIARRADGSRLVTLALTLAAFSLYVGRALNVRSHLFSYLCLAILLHLLDRFERAPRRVDLWVPALCALWANLHGVEYPIPLAVIAIYAGTALIPHLRQELGAVLRDWQVLRWPLLLVLSGLAFLVNPYGSGLLGTALIGRETEVLAHIQEMAPYE